MTPQWTDILTFQSKALSNTIESAKQFARWMDGTCLECKPVKGAGEDETVTYTLYNDIQKSASIYHMKLSLTIGFRHRIVSDGTRYLDSWGKYNKVFGLWDPKRKAAMDGEGSGCSLL